MQSADVSLFYQHSEEKHAAQLEEKSRDHKNRRDRYLLLLFLQSTWLNYLLSFFPFLLVISCDFVLVIFAGHRSMAATLLLQKIVALATDVNFPWLINFLIGIILQDTKTGIQSTIKRNTNILKATRADILRMSINIIQTTDIKPVILFSTSGSWVKDSMSNLWGRKIYKWSDCAMSSRMELYHHD